MLPLDVVETNIWRRLPPASRRSLRLACRQSRLLAASHATSAELDFRSRGSQDHQVNSDTADESDDEAPELDFHGRLRRWRAFLTRLPRVTALTLLNWASEPDLVTTLLHLGVATQHRLTRLTLSGEHVCDAVGCAVRVAAPRLQELTLRGGHPFFDSVNDIVIEGNFFLPLLDSPLTKLVVLGGINMEDGEPELSGLRSLSHLLRQLPQTCGANMAAASILGLPALSHLQHLDLFVDDVASQHLRALSKLPHLTHCHLRDSEDGDDVLEPPPGLSLRDFAPLFSLTKLTHLHLLRLREAAGDVAGARPLAGVATLRNLGGLRSLGFTPCFVLRDTVFCEVQRLTALTRLCIGRAALTPSNPPGGHLPGLQHLQVAGLRPSALLRTLAPLLPLPSLIALDSHTVGRLCIDVSCAGPGAAGSSLAELAALDAAVKHLVAAPRLRPPTYLSLDRLQVSPPSHLSLSHLAAGLRPWAAFVTHVRFLQPRLSEFGWAGLWDAFPSLHGVSVVHGTVSDLGLMAAARELPGLGRLELCGVEGVSSQGWLGLAAARAGGDAAHLLLVVTPPPEDEVVARCRRAGALRLGPPCVTWASLKCFEGNHVLL